jgi:hypothetical protein
VLSKIDEHYLLAIKHCCSAIAGTEIDTNTEDGI